MNFSRTISTEGLPPKLQRTLSETQQQIRRELLRKTQLSIPLCLNVSNTSSIVLPMTPKSYKKAPTVVDGVIVSKPYADLLKAVPERVMEMQRARILGHTAVEKIHKELPQFLLEWRNARMAKKEKKERQRIKVLRENDWEAYTKMVHEHNSHKIAEFVDRTTTYMVELAKRIMYQRNEDVNEEAVRRDFLNVFSSLHHQTENVYQPKQFPDGLQLKKYQLEGLEFLVSLHNNEISGILADQMGLGKTIQTLALCAYLQEAHDFTGPYLILMPKSTLANWQREAQKWVPNLRALLYHGQKKEREEMAENIIKPGKFDLLFTTYRLSITDEVLKKVKWKYIIVDEGHKLKNKATQLFKGLLSYGVKHRLLLTGTPLQNSVDELWNLLNFLLPNVFRDFTKFEEFFSAPFQQNAELTPVEQEEIIMHLHVLLRPFLLRRTKDNVRLELPQKSEHVMFCPMSAWQRLLYDRYVKDQPYRFLESGATQALGTSHVDIELRKVAQHPWLMFELGIGMYHNPLDDAISSANLVRVSGKFLMLDRVLAKLHATGHRVLVFFQWKETLFWVEQLMQMRRYKYLVMHGDTTAEQREQSIDDFNDPNSEYFVYLLTTRTGGLGVNLQSADTVIIFNSDWNPQSDLQAQDRAHRIGQTREVKVLRFASIASVEQHLLERIKFRLEVTDKVISAGGFHEMNYDDKDVTESKQKLRSMINQGKHGFDLADPMSDKDMNDLLTRGEGEVSVFEDIDKQLDEELEGYLSKTGVQVPTDEDRFKELRLISMNELPDFVVNPPVFKHAMDIPETRQRRRVVTNARFADDMNNAQFMQYCRDSKRGGNVTPVPSETGVRAKESILTVNSIATPFERIVTPRPEEPFSVKTAMHWFSVLKSLKKDVDGRSSEGRHSDSFFELPSVNEHPRFYNVVQSPICLTDIKKKIVDEEYESIQAFLDDMQLCFNSYLVYFEPNSEIGHSATTLLHHLQFLVKENL
ncbi:hypothetical protein PCE1_000721 [Barthelona sp. PCE]